MAARPVSEPLYLAPRARFNSGFHDGNHAAEQGFSRNWTSHPDRFYAEGYAAGHAAFLELRVRSDSSEPAWAARRV